MDGSSWGVYLVPFFLPATGTGDFFLGALPEVCTPPAPAFNF